MLRKVSLIQQLETIEQQKLEEKSFMSDFFIQLNLE